MTDEPDPKGNPIGTELVFEDDSVRVWRIDLAPGEKAGWHTHFLDYTRETSSSDRTPTARWTGSR